MRTGTKLPKMKFRGTNDVRLSISELNTCDA
jgi:hypothetical protein